MQPNLLLLPSFFYKEFIALENKVNALTENNDETIRSIIQRDALYFSSTYSLYINSDNRLKNRLSLVEGRINTIYKADGIVKKRIHTRPVNVPTLTLPLTLVDSVSTDFHSPIDKNTLNNTVDLIYKLYSENEFDNQLIYQNIKKAIDAIIALRKCNLDDCDNSLDRVFDVITTILKNPYQTKNFTEKEIIFLLETVGKKLSILDLKLDGSPVSVNVLSTILKFNTNLSVLKLCGPNHFDRRMHSNDLDFDLLDNDIKRFANLKLLKHLEIYHCKNIGSIAYYLPNNLKTLIVNLERSIESYNNKSSIYSPLKTQEEDVFSDPENATGFSADDITPFILKYHHALMVIDLSKTTINLTLVQLILINCIKLKKLNAIIKH